MFHKHTLLTCVIALASFSAAASNPPVSGTVGDVPFPDKSRSYLPVGDFVNVGNLRQMRTGLNKDQVRLLLGNPHFREGIFGADQWNYIFNFHTGEGDAFITCQYQVRYDKQRGGYRAQSLHWDGPACLELANAGGASAPATGETRFNLSADVLFAFGRHGRQDMQEAGKRELDAIAQAIADAHPRSVRVVGHTDRIGSEADNQLLSERRAATVRGYLLEKGVAAAATVAEGRGELEPVKQCGDLPRAALIDCLAPNRRVEVVVNGTER